MNNQIKRINFNHSFIFFLFCNIFSLITFVNNNLTISPLICFLLILSIGVSHGSLDNMKGKKLFEEIFVEQKKRIYNAFKNSDSDSVIKFKSVLNKIINE